MNADREKHLDAIVWRHTGKRLRECTPGEISGVIAALEQEAAKDRERARVAELRIAGHRAAIDQYHAMVADSIGQAERWANGGDG